jgi:hypothetical protein
VSSSVVICFYRKLQSSGDWRRDKKRFMKNNVMAAVLADLNFGHDWTKKWHFIFVFLSYHTNAAYFCSQEV